MRHNTMSINNVILDNITPEAEDKMAYIARVSNPRNQKNKNTSGLLRYCIEHGHWSVFEHSTMTLEITTTVAIATQILRHRSFKFQQFSQRYATPEELVKMMAQHNESSGHPDDMHLMDNSMLCVPDLRRQDHKNRQNSLLFTTDEEKAIVNEYLEEINKIYDALEALYGRMTNDKRVEIAKEVARFILPQGTKTKLYMTGDVRSWIHYINLRSGHGTQLEHMAVANQAKNIFVDQLPIVSKALTWDKVA